MTRRWKSQSFPTSFLTALVKRWNVRKRSCTCFWKDDDIPPSLVTVHEIRRCSSRTFQLFGTLRWRSYICRDVLCCNIYLLLVLKLRIILLFFFKQVWRKIEIIWKRKNITCILGLNGEKFNFFLNLAHNFCYLFKDIVMLNLLSLFFSSYLTFIKCYFDKSSANCTYLLTFELNEIEDVFAKNDLRTMCHAWRAGIYRE